MNQQTNKKVRLYSSNFLDKIQPYIVGGLLGVSLLGLNGCGEDTPALSTTYEKMHITTTVDEATLSTHKDYQKKLKWAQAGNINAMNDVGYLFQHGKHVQINIELAIKWYQKAAERGQGLSWHNLGQIYYYGEGVEKDIQKAFACYHAAVELDNPPAAFHNLAHMYREGIGVEKDYKKAAELYTKAADKGYAYSQIAVGHLYLTGRGVERDDDKAYAYFKDSIVDPKEEGVPDGYFFLGVCYLGGFGTSQDYTKGVQYLKKASNKGSNRAKQTLVKLYEKDSNPSLGKRYALEAEKNGDSEYLYNYAHMYDVGDGVKEDNVKALRWYIKAAEQGHIYAAYAAKRILYSGEGKVAKDLKRAEYWRKKIIQMEKK